MPIDPLDREILNKLYDLCRNLSLIGSLLIALYGGWRRWWVFGWQYNECHDRRVKLETQLFELNAKWSNAVLVSRRLQELHISDDGC